MKKTNRLLFCVLISFLLVSFSLPQDGFVSVKGKEIITPDGKPILLRGINLGNG